MSVHNKLNDIDMDKIIRLTFGKINLINGRVLLKEYSTDFYFFAYLDSSTLVRVSKDRFRDIVKRIRSKYSVTVKYVKIDKATVLQIRNKQDNKWNEVWQAQSLISSIFSSFSTAVEQIGAVKSKIAALRSFDFKLLMIDVLAIIMEIRDGYLTFGKIFSVLLSLYTSYHRFTSLFTPQVTSIVDLALGFSMIGLPTRIIELIKTFTTITGKRIFDSTVIYECLATFSEILLGILDFFHTPIGGVTMLPDCIYLIMKGFLGKIFGTFNHYRQLQVVVELYTAYVRNPQITFDPVFREKVSDTYNKSINMEGFLEYVTNVQNKFLNITWTNFKEVVYKAINAFGASRREEPICFVFEGAAGSGKSTFMNAVVDLFRSANRTVYCHTVPSTEDSKDFYDDYQNQEVFVMDDVGQQGKSQWRTIINYVSPVVYPLSCATASLKNTKTFNSKVVLCTTNQLSNLTGFTSSDCISTPEALFRRIHLIKVVKNCDDEKFSQTLTYHKYDHLGDLQWKNEFLYHHKTTISPIFDNRTSDKPLMDNLKWFWSIFKHIESKEEANRNLTSLPDSFFEEILGNTIFVDAPSYQPQSFLTDLVNTLGDTSILLKEWSVAALKIAQDYLTWILPHIATTVVTLLRGEVVLGVKLPSWIDRDEREVDIPIHVFLLITVIIVAVVSFCFGKKGEWKPSSMRDNFERSRARASEFRYTAQTGFLSEVDKEINDIQNERVVNVSKFCRMIVVKHSYEEAGDDEVCQAIVSGKHILLPAHLTVKKRFIDVFVTLEHYENGHKELENIELELIRLYPSCDMAVYEIKGTVPLYKKCWNLFPQDVNINPLFYLISAVGSFPIIYGSSLHPNEQNVSYSRYVAGERKEFNHGKSSGMITPLSGPGLCGTVLVSQSGGVVGFHVAGTGTSGFCVTPSATIAQEIRSIMLSGQEPNFDLDRKDRKSVV